MKRDLAPVISVDENKCVNCHMCISVCPVKFCIDGSGEYVSINHNLCIGCGRCIAACTHEARSWIDDSADFFDALEKDNKLIAVVAPAVASVFPAGYLKLNGFLKSMGIDRVFDVSFGAELTVKSYLEHVKKNKPKSVIAQPCPAIVTYIELYKPMLIPYLAPAHSPMLHTIKMVREFYPELRDHKVAVVSPCLAKKREFLETGHGDYNVTFLGIKRYLREQGLELDNYAEIPYDNPPAERAVLFSSPGGLMKTVERENPELANRTRKIEGPENIYPYLDKLAEIIKKDLPSPLVDCLNCEAGCNGGPGTGNFDKPLEELEQPVIKRGLENEKHYEGKTFLSKKGRKRLGRILNRYWKDGLYTRSYLDLSGNFNIREPKDSDLKSIYESMHKYDKSRLYNCASCGYNSCAMMAKAVFNGLNKPENCHHYQKEEVTREQDLVKALNGKLNEEIVKVDSLVASVYGIMERVNEKSLNQYACLEESSAAITEMMASIVNASNISSRKTDALAELIEVAKKGESDMTSTVAAINDIAVSMTGIEDMIKVINDVASNTNLLSMNAAIEAAHAGNAGRGFAVVAAEIRRLAETTSRNSVQISRTLGGLNNKINSSSRVSEETAEVIRDIIGDVMNTASSMNELLLMLQEMSAGSSQITEALTDLRDVSDDVKVSYESITAAMENIKGSMLNLRKMSEESLSVVRAG